MIGKLGGYAGQLRSGTPARAISIVAMSSSRLVCLHMSNISGLQILHHGLPHGMKRSLAEAGGRCVAI